jgi:hypothetical protein
VFLNTGGYQITEEARQVKTDIRRHILTLSLSGILAALGAPTLIAQNSSPQTPTATAASNTVDAVKAEVAGDRQDVQALQEKTTNDKSKLKADVKQYGKNSPQVAADKAAVKADGEQAKVLRKDVAKDRANVAKAQQMKKNQEIKNVHEKVQDVRSTQPSSLDAAQIRQTKQHVNAVRANQSGRPGMAAAGHGGHR